MNIVKYLRRSVSVLAMVLATSAFAGRAPGDVDVRDFGAKGDGVTDDTAAFTAAGEAIWKFSKAERRTLRQRYRKEKSGAQEGPRRRIYVPKGRYLISGPVFLRSDAFLAGEDGTELVGTNPSNDIVYVYAAFRVRIENIAFRGGRSHLKIETLNNESANIRITGCRFRGSAYTAFYSPSFGIGGKGVGEWRYDDAQRRFVRDERYHSPKTTDNNHSSMVVVDNCEFEHCAGAIDMCPDGAVVRNCTFAMAPGAKKPAIVPDCILHGYGLKFTHHEGSSALGLLGGKTALWLEDSSVTTPDGSGACVFTGGVANSAQVAHVIMADVRTDAGLRPGNAICDFDGSFPAIAALVRVTAEGPNEVAAFRFAPDESEERFNVSRSFKSWEIDRFFSYGIRDCSANISSLGGDAKRFVREVPSWAAEAGGTLCHMECPKLENAVHERLEPKWHVKFRTRVIERDTVMECGGVAAFVGVGSDAPWFVVKKGAKAVFRNLQVHGGKSFVVVEEGAEAYVDSCYSYDSDGVTFVCQKGGRLVVDNGVYYAGCLYDGDGDSVIRSIWYKFTDVVPYDMPIGNESAIVNRGQLVLWDVLGVPQVFSRFDKASFPTLPPTKIYSVRWVDNFGDLKSRMFRYGSERGGLTPAWHHGNAKTIIEGHYAGFWNQSVPDTPVMCDAPDSDVRIFGVAFSLSRHRLKKIEMHWRDAEGKVHLMPDAQIHLTCPTKETSEIKGVNP